MARTLAAAGRDLLDHPAPHLTTVLLAGSAVLTDGRSSMPRAVEELVRALIGRGATGMALPRCGECGKTSLLHGRRGQVRICSVCAGRQAPCGRCGRHRRVAYRDRHGQQRCRRCPPTTHTGRVP